MEPFSPQDPLSKLLGKAKAAEPRPNFTQNVMRAVRQLPQGQSVWERLSEWFHASPMRPSLSATCAALLAVAMTGLWLHHKDTSNELALAEKNAASPVFNGTENDVATTLDQMEQFSNLLAQQDTHSMSDNDLALLLY